MQTAVLFDLDGVLIDTEGQYSRFWQSIGKRDFPDNPDFAAQIKGSTLVQIFERYYPTDAAARKRVTDDLNRFETDMTFPFIAGAMDFVASLRTEGFKVAVVTSSNQAKMACLFQHHPDFASNFDRIFTAEDAQRSKPAPDCYINAAHYFGFEPADCYVFEDSMSGLRAGLDSGAVVIGLATTNSISNIKSFCRHAMVDFTDFSVNEMCNLKD